MSGPRPMLKDFVALYFSRAARRLEVKPRYDGLSSGTVVEMNLIMKSVLNVDVWYVDNHNTLVDFKIMFKTVGVMTKREGINAPGQWLAFFISRK